MKSVRGTKSTTRKKAPAKTAAATAISATPPEAPVATASVATRSNGSATASDATVTICAKIDVGFGNALYLRGEGPGLNWNQGIPLACVDNSTWQWSGKAKDRLKFKLLLNDAVWSQGEDLVATPGDKIEVSPRF